MSNNNAGRERRSKQAIEAMCVAVLRRVPGVGEVNAITIRPIDKAESGSNWELASISVNPAPDVEVWQRAEQRLQPWRRKYELA